MLDRVSQLRRCAALVLGAAGLFVATVAQAAPRFAVLLPEVQPAVTPELAQRFHEAVAQGFQSSAIDIIPPAETRMRLSAVADLDHCAGGPCTQHAAAVLGVGAVVTIHLSALGKDYSLKLAVVDRAGQEVARVDETCDVCTVREVVEALHRAGAKLATDPRTQAAPTEAATTTTRLPEPVPPAERPVTPPPTEPASSPPSTSSSQSRTVAAPVAATSPPSSPGGEPTVLWRGLGGGAVALGAIGLGVGIALLVIDGRPTCNLPDPIHNCPQVYNTKGGGAALVAIGAVALASSGVFFYLDHRAHTTAPRLSLSPIWGGGQMAAVWDF